eukprot:CAMPEP_0172450260 /NCGR_PEP_ID=MMETSP1065-20121228/8680_1 /TAXON_ID=265537 /ORGANISM="Amphiprora paludosa, Strain CCMP125" /LENGTH=636 /DNA_ID=CAMNT_0013202039 /DNA_START=29 /DNA_END=1939 /DNA_ORIENTATION=+
MADENNGTEPKETPSEDVVGGSSNVQRLNSATTSGMESSTLSFRDLGFTIGKGEKAKNILSDVTSMVKSGRVLAVMGPSGAGKTTLLNALTLDAPYGVATGAVKLNGVPLTDKIFKEHCYVVKQQDKHWPYLSCRETIKYATQLYGVVAKEQEDALVDEIIEKLGLQICADTMAARMSGGQRRRLSVGIALVKQPRVMFLDEPTTGLDAASALKMMQGMIRVAKDEGLVTICTIHQPSSKVYDSFDQTMVMSQGRVAYVGDVKEAVPYFADIGYPMPDDTNPAEFFLDLVNADFSDEAEVVKILDQWEEKGPGIQSSHHSNPKDDDEVGVVNLDKKPLLPEIPVLFSRHFKLILRDPILYIGRGIMFLVSNLIFALVYLKARDDVQSQALNKFWVTIWFVAVPSQLGVVAVYALNDEFKSLLRETKNGMLSGVSYVVAKSVLTLPIMYIFSLFALGIPFYAVIGGPGESFAWSTILFCALIFNFESLSECLSVWFDDPILGMLQFMNYWFGAFLFGGFLIPQQDMYWPFELFYYIMPYSYYVRSFMYNYFSNISFEACDPTVTFDQAVCVPADQPDGTTSGLAVLESFSSVFPLLSTKDESAKDVGIILAMAFLYKSFYIIGVVFRTGQASKIVPN